MALQKAVSWIIPQNYLSGRPRATFWGSHLSNRQHSSRQGGWVIELVNTTGLSESTWSCSCTSPSGAIKVCELSQREHRIKLQAPFCPHLLCYVCLVLTTSLSNPTGTTGSSSCYQPQLPSLPFLRLQHPTPLSVMTTGHPLQPTLGIGMSTAATALGSWKKKVKQRRWRWNKGSRTDFPILSCPAARGCHESLRQQCTPGKSLKNLQVCTKWLCIAQVRETATYKASWPRSKLKNLEGKLKLLLVRCLVSPAHMNSHF